MPQARTRFEQMPGPVEMAFGCPFKTYRDKAGKVYNDIAICGICDRAVDVGSELRDHATAHLDVENF